jgi:hypothetical protein
MLKNMFNDLNIDKDFVSYISPTYRHTISDDIYNIHVKEQLVLKLRKNGHPLKHSELSLFLNYKSILEHICKNYKDGLFLILESDVAIGRDIKLFNEFMDFVNSKKTQFDLIHIGMYTNEIWRSISEINFETGYSNRNLELIRNISTEDITNSSNKFRLIRKFHTRCCDSFLWTYTGAIKFLDYLNTETNYGVPFDYYMINFFEQNPKFKHYWSVNEFFIQQSNLGLIKSTIQGNNS